MKFAAFVFATLFASAAFARPIEKRDAASTGLQISYDGNATLSNEAAYTFLATDLTAISADGMSFIVYTAVEGSGEANSQSGSVSANGIMGFVVTEKIYDIAEPPTVFQMYFNEKADWDTGSLSGPGDVSVVGSASFAAMVYDTIEEVDNEGGVVAGATISLKDITFNTSAIQYDDVAGAPQALSYTTLYGTAPGGATISIAVVLSEVIGHLSVGADVTPQSLETVLEVSGYKYQNENNHLRLNLIAGTGSLSGEVDVSDDGAVVTWGYGASAPYVTLYQTVDAGSSSDTAMQTSVTVSSWTNYDESSLGTSFLGSLVTALGEEGVPVKFVSATVDFPAGAAYLLYDPQTGFNQPNSRQSGSSTSGVDNGNNDNGNGGNGKSSGSGSGGAATLVPGLAVLVLSALAAYLKF